MSVELIPGHFIFDPNICNNKYILESGMPIQNRKKISQNPASHVNHSLNHRPQSNTSYSYEDLKPSTYPINEPPRGKVPEKVNNINNEHSAQSDDLNKKEIKIDPQFQEKDTDGSKVFLK